MAISIVSDLVLDVVKAANPERARIAHAGLQRGQSVASSAREFADAENTVKRNPGIGRFLTTDIVGDVVNAADPSKLKTSIAQLSGTSNLARVDMSGLVLKTTDSVSDAATEPAKAVNPKEKAFQQFEASVLRNFVEEMLPKATENAYGEGTAGNVWRSMQADFMSQELAKSGGIGIASTLARLDEARARSQPGATLNEIAPKADRVRSSITNTSEWPYFSRPKIGVLES
ncbi:MAG: rod-binding protein [Aestuariivirga sp.]|nr:rod-binding protein [Aestuariivirga sp.]